MAHLYRKTQSYSKPKRSIYLWKPIFILMVIVGVYWLFQGAVHSEQENVEKTYADRGSDYSSRPVLEQMRYSDNVLGEAVVRHTIQEGDIPADVLSRYGRYDANDTAALLVSAEDIYDFTNMKIGQEVRFYFNGEERAERIEYDRNTEDVVVADRIDDEFTVRQEQINYDITREIVRIKIDEFFYVDALEAGLSEATIIEVADVFAYSIDFTTEIRQGDELHIIYEKRMREGKPATDGKIIGAKFINDGSSYYAYHFDNDGEGGYYDEEGRAIVRQFLKAPLSFSRITSGFTGARLHPITRQITAHYQIDYAAPTGTPVVSTARGTVTSAGWENGWGYIVRVRHDNGYTTHYAHLSGFAAGVRSGVRVAQGQLVGYVGSTGWSTGPHLDYGMKLNGSPVNPLKLDQPKGEPLVGDNMKRFEEIQNTYRNVLDNESVRVSQINE